MSDVESPETSDKIKLEEEEEAMESNLADPGNFWGHEIFFPETADVGSNVKEEASENAAQEDQNNDMEDSAAEGTFALCNDEYLGTAESTNTGDFPELITPKASGLQTPQNILKEYLDKLSEKKTFICPHCGHESDNLSSLSSHILTHSNNGGTTNFLKFGPEKPTDDDQWPTSIAPYKNSAKDSENILKDYLEKYANKKIRKCPHCNHESNTLGKLQRHILTHSSTNLLKCSICEYRSNRKDTLKDHMLTHTFLKLFKCTECDFATNRKYSLKNHMTTHSTDKSFNCTECQYQCNNRRNLKRHMLVHLENKLFKCSLCDYECNRKHHLNIHMLTHSNIKLYKCANCPFESNHKQSLKEHMFTHLSIKLFKCPECSYECNFKKALRRHMNIHKKQRQEGETTEGSQSPSRSGENDEEVLPTDIGDSTVA